MFEKNNKIKLKFSNKIYLVKLLSLFFFVYKNNKQKKRAVNTRFCPGNLLNLKNIIIKI